eukprot:9534936-Alexandrium_andersonii.AAC.1
MQGRRLPCPGGGSRARGRRRRASRCCRRRGAARAKRSRQRRRQPMDTTYKIWIFVEDMEENGAASRVGGWRPPRARAPQ